MKHLLVCVTFSCLPGFNQSSVEDKSKYLAQGNKYSDFGGF